MKCGRARSDDPITRQREDVTTEDTSLLLISGSLTMLRRDYVRNECSRETSRDRRLEVCNDTTSVVPVCQRRQSMWAESTMRLRSAHIDKLAYLRMLLTGRCEPIASNRGTLLLLLWIHGERITIGIYRTISLEWQIYFYSRKTHEASF